MRKIAEPTKTRGRINPVKRIGLIANLDKIASRQLIRKVARTIERQGRTVLADSGTLRLADLSVSSFPDVTSLAREVDLLLVFGGDGKSLRDVKLQIIALNKEPETFDLGEWGSAFLTLPNGIYRFRFERPGYETKEVESDLTPLADIDLTVELKPKAN